MTARSHPIEPSLPAPAPGAGSERRVGAWIAVSLFLSLLIFQGGDLAWSDGISMYEVARSIVEDHDVAIVHGVVWEGADGRYYSPFGIGLSLLAVPVYGVIWLARRVISVPPFVAQGIVSLLSPLLLALVSVATFALARRLGGHVRTSALAALGVAGGTFLLVYGKTFSSEPLAVLLVTLSIERVLAGSPTMAGTALGGAALARPQTLLFAPFLLWGLWRRGGAGAVLRGSWPLLIAAMVQVAYNLARFGDVANFGYTGTEVPQGFTTPILTGLQGLLLHPEKSVLLFAPIVILGPPALSRLFRVDRTAAVLITAQVGITLALAATWWDWGGGFTWGPRLLIPAIPPLVAAIPAWADARPVRRRAVACLLLVGFAVSAPSLLVGGGAQLAERPPPEEGPRIAGQFRLVPDAVDYTIDHLYEDQDGRDPTRVLYLWQAGAAYRIGPAGLLASIAITAGLAIGAVLSVRRLTNELRRADPMASAGGDLARADRADDVVVGAVIGGEPAPSGRERERVETARHDEEAAVADREREVLEHAAEHRTDDVDAEGDGGGGGPSEAFGEDQVGDEDRREREGRRRHEP